MFTVNILILENKIVDHLSAFLKKKKLLDFLRELYLTVLKALPDKDSYFLYWEVKPLNKQIVNI